VKPLIAVLVGLLAFAVSLPASAHVTVSSADATRGGYAVVVLQVPDESDTASTVRVSVQLPPFASVDVQAVAGWTITTSSSKLATPLTTDDGDTVTSAITRIDWTAASTATGIAPGRFEQFAISVGPLPDADTVSFATLQTYSDGKTVAWNEEAAPGGAEPDHPKPTLSLVDATPKATAAPSTTAPTLLSIVAMVIAAAALAVAVVGSARRRA
jgi:uncharacterized protein YcnI